MSKDISNSLVDFKEIRIDALINKANNLKPSLIKLKKNPEGLIEISKGPKDYTYKKTDEISKAYEKTLKKDSVLTFDFGQHIVGRLCISFSVATGMQDAPLYIKVKLGEHIAEIAEDSNEYNGRLSKSWIQEEYFHIDTLPFNLELSRRYAFRFVELTVIDTSPDYGARLDNIYAISETSADVSKVEPLSIHDDVLKQLDDISINTMRECMQDVFEDGPKRDRRLWIGDLRLQALTNYETFKNYDLVKRCIYLFAGLQQNDGRIGACLYTKPCDMVSSTHLFDYALFFISCVYDYYCYTKDIDFVKELWDIAYHQIEIAELRLDDNYIVKDSDDWWCFIDWNDSLNKQAGAQAILIYTAKQALELARILNDEQRFERLSTLIGSLENASRNILFDKDKGFFISGDERQVSWASQIWFILAGVFDKEDNQKLIKRLINENPDVNMVTPYMYHHYIDALIKCDCDSLRSHAEVRQIQIEDLGTHAYLDLAKKEMIAYWGKMAELGADCFWETFDPQDVTSSPYGSRVINSYCHAWSGTPAYFIRKYFSTC